MAGDRRQALGQRGEDLAARELARLGYVILARRYRTRLGEIDIVARDGATVVFVEVKARTGEGWGRPAEAVGWRKQQRLVTMAQMYLARHRLGAVACRFDVVSVLDRPGESAVVDVVRSAFDVTGA